MQERIQNNAIKKGNSTQRTPDSGRLKCRYQTLTFVWSLRRCVYQYFWFSSETKPYIPQRCIGVGHRLGENTCSTFLLNLRHYVSLKRDDYCRLRVAKNGLAQHYSRDFKIRTGSLLLRLREYLEFGPPSPASALNQSLRCLY